MVGLMGLRALRFWGLELVTPNPKPLFWGGLSPTPPCPKPETPRGISASVLVKLGTLLLGSGFRVLGVWGFRDLGV